MNIPVAIVAAMEREVKPLVRDWDPGLLEFQGRSWKMFFSPRAIVVCGGIGAEPAARVTRALLSRYRPEIIVSAGLAGALCEGWRVGTTVIANEVVDADSGARFRFEHGLGTVVTAKNVVGVEEKRTLAHRFNARLVDMEAAAVGKVAHDAHIQFVAVKSVSDELGFPMPPMNRFIDKDGVFHTIRFALYAALRPRWWSILGELQRNSETAAESLCEVLWTIIDKQSKGEFRRDLELQPITLPKM